MLALVEALKVEQGVAVANCLQVAKEEVEEDLPLLETLSLFRGFTGLSLQIKHCSWEGNSPLWSEVYAGV